MMNKLTPYVLAFALSINLIGCDHYLDVQPVDKFLEEQVYNKESSTKAALNGIYMNMAKSNLYGQNLSATTIDVLAQYYNCGASTHPYYMMSAYRYSDQQVQNTMDVIWRNAYRAVLNLNLFIERVSATEGVMSEANKDILLGEAYGMRAFISFDMLRLFGPIYDNDSTSMSMPYKVTADDQISPLYPAREIVQFVLDDLDQAEQYLANDPIINKGIETEDIIDNTHLLRNRRFNFYAVQALKARVCLYRGDRTSALSYATRVIEQDEIFPWSPANLSSPGNSNPDRVFSSEVLFGVENQALYTGLQNGNFAATLTNNLLVPVAAQLSDIYENNLNDYRFRVNWLVDGNSNKPDKTFFKYADIVDKSKNHRFFIPLIRISEMYLIAAECSDDESLALDYLNTLQRNRGLSDLDNTSHIVNEISKAYQKEFWGEGQTFFFYKRTSASQIRNGNGTGNISMDLSKYQIPLPLSETQYR